MTRWVAACAAPCVGLAAGRFIETARFDRWVELAGLLSRYHRRGGSGILASSERIVSASAHTSSAGLKIREGVCALCLSVRAYAANSAALASLTSANNNSVIATSALRNKLRANQPAGQ